MSCTRVLNTDDNVTPTNNATLPVSKAGHRKNPLAVQLRLLSYLQPYWRNFLPIITTMILSIGVDLLRPWPTKLLVDQILGQHPAPAYLNRWLAGLPGPHGVEGLLLWVCIGTVLIYVIGTIVSMANTYASVQLGYKLAYNLGADLFLHLQRLSQVFHSRRPAGDMSIRVNEDAFCVQVLVTGGLLPLLQSVITLIMMFAIMWRIEPTMTILALGVAPFMMPLIHVFGRLVRERCQVKRDLEGRMASLVHQSLSAIPAIQAYGREETEHARFRIYAQNTLVAHQKAVTADLWFKLFVGLVQCVGTAMIMWLGARYALDGKVSAGTILVFLSYLGSLYWPLNSITCMASTLQSAEANAKRVIEILDTQPCVQDSPDACEVKLRGRVCYEDVTFGYESERPTLKGVSLQVEAGEVVAIIGPSGAGKTTLVNLLARFYDPVSGRITIDNHDIRDLPLRSLRKQVAIVLQEPFIFPVTVAENIAYGRPDATREQIIEAALAANAHDFIERLPAGYDTVIGERGTTLSGGEKQRLSVASAFLKDAPILVLDEPTSALDSRTERLLLEALDRLMKSRTTFIIAHRLSTIKNASRIVVMDSGTIVEHGKHADLLALEGLYTKLYRQQMDVTPFESPKPPLEIQGPLLEGGYRAAAAGNHLSQA